MSLNKKPVGSIHRIREFELEKIHLSDEFDILQIVGEGWFGKILLVEHRVTDTEMVLKALPKPYVSLRDFYREFHYGLHLGLHKNIVTTYDVAFETAGFYVFTQEYAPLGDLTSNVAESGIGELHSKRVAKQIASALDYMHAKEIVHRDVKLDNVLIYKSDFSRVKLCDFGESYQKGTIVERRNEWLPYSPPEVLQIKPEGTYKAEPGHDVWQFGIVIFVCLTGCLPWQKAASDDPRYVRYTTWQGTSMVLPLRRTPKLFKLLSSKGCRMFRKFLDPRSDRRPRNLADLSKFIDDRWLAKGAEKDLAENEQDELCPSMYSFHSSPEEKNKLLSTLAEYGIETTVDRVAKKNRIRDWIESSVITEEDEEDDSGTATPSSTMSREPVAGHISSVRAEEAAQQQQHKQQQEQQKLHQQQQEQQKTINTTLKDSSHKHFDPRTGALQQGPSEMGAINKSESLIITNGKLRSYDTGSVSTLASRNDLILSEGQSYHSELNLATLGETTAEPLVNAHFDIPLSDNNKYNNLYAYNEKVSLNFADNENITKTNNCYNSSNNNHNILLQRNPDQLNQKYYSSISLNNNNNNYNSHSNNNNNSNSYYNNGRNVIINRGLITPFKSVATISVPEIDQSIHQKLEAFSNNNASTNSFTVVRSKQDSGYGSYDKIKSFDVSTKPNNRSSSVVSKGKSNVLPSSTNENGIRKNSESINRNGTTTTTTATTKKLALSPTTNRGRGQTDTTATMKDTPYDRITAKKSK